MKSHVRNLTNLYTKTNVNKLNNDFKRIIEQSRGGICGIEALVKKGGTDFTLVSPSFVKGRDKLRSSPKDRLTESSMFYEGYLYEPFFLPISVELDGEFIERLNSLAFVLDDDESVFMQWLLKRAYGWEDKAIQLYSSYILGNDYPLSSNFVRKIQEKMISIVGRFGVHSEVKDYIDEAEHKITSEGYNFRLNFAIDSSTERRKFIINRLQGLFDQYTFYNAIKIGKIKNKNLLQQMKDCEMTPDTKYQILSLQEILSLFGGNDGLIIEETIIETTNEEPLQTEIIVGDGIELLPNCPIEDAPVHEGIVKDVEDALKRVGVIKASRVYDAKLTTGMRLTVLQFKIPPDKNLTDITKRQKDIQAALGVNSLTIEQGDVADTVRLLIPNEEPAIVGLQAVLELDSFKAFREKNELAFVVGLDEINEPIYLSLAELAHLLVAGTTGSGKSVFLNQLIVTLLLFNSPSELQMVLIDPKLVELQQYKDYPHVKEVVSDMSRAEMVLAELAYRMDERYHTFSEVGVNIITDYNEMIRTGELDVEIMPYVVCVIDEYADLKMLHPEVEDHIARLAQKARACGIHLVVGTQRPSKDIIGGNVTANITNAISFYLSDANDYKTVFGKGIPYTLLGKGDGVMRITGWKKLFQRFQSPIISPVKSEERQFYQTLKNHLNMKYPTAASSEGEERVEIVVEEKEVDNLEKLKQIIATTKETRTTELRKHMGIKNETLSQLMKELVAEGFLEFRSKQEGYKINEEKLNDWIGKNS